MSASSWPASSSGRLTRAPVATKTAAYDSSCFHERFPPTRTPQRMATPCARTRSISRSSTSRGRWYSGMPWRSAPPGSASASNTSTP